MELLVGFTGFVGSNLSARHQFDMLVNSKNVAAAFGTAPGLCVYAGVRAEKFLANTAPEKDSAHIDEAVENLKRINPKRLVLISTVDVYKSPAAVDELTEPETSGLHPYGLNRLRLEKWARENVERHLIVRLPALFGRNLKKNFIYDLINVVPSMLNEARYSELAKRSRILAQYYTQDKNGFYVYSAQDSERPNLKKAFESEGFSSVNFTDSRAVFQFYNLAYLWNHIETALEKDLRLLHLAAEPLSASEIYSKIRGGTFINELEAPVPHYDFRTIHARSFHGRDGYLFDKKTVLEEIAAFAGEVSGVK